ncbi:AlwI family type II restriction endonuclease [Chitinophaga lutea]|uniref:AlwI family type II restriction endonuclease n=1 Tax=Chitinophaga lutea TaxID=2488634 RepID=A0A3N4Q5H0_9BACT|nr:AlwI family type II restriction endonuclease [Chitinophaga lutea]RPE12761.1 AlwI family type II restriction endonuclease [Chitinophaga lutea]
MPKVWNIGNTTVRNPNRIESALRVFEEEGFSGHVKGSEAEARLHLMLREKQVLEFDGEPSDWNGRKWRAAFYQLGFISFERYAIGALRYEPDAFFRQIRTPGVTLPFQLTPAGEKLVADISVPEIEDIYTRQLVCYELPNALEGRFPPGAKMKPFILFLQVLKRLQDNGKAGLSKYETGLFLQPFRNHTATLPDEIYGEILHFRKEAAACRNSQDREALETRYEAQLQQRVGIKPQSVLSDYSDTTFRYFSLSGLLMRIGSTIVIRTNKRNFVDTLLQTEPHFQFQADPLQYFRHFYNNTYPIPTDDTAVALHEISELRRGVRNPDSPVLQQAAVLTATTPAEQIQATRYALIEYHNREREADYALEQQSETSIHEIIAYLRKLNGERFPGAPEIDDKPAYFEWAVWRSFLAINDIRCAVHETRRFPVDHDFKPRNTAPGGGADVIFEFEEYVLMIEVTLTANSRQMATESEPVRRHAVQCQQQYGEKPVYGLFIAPQVDNNVVETFRSGTWYSGDVEYVSNVVPMNLPDFTGVIARLLTGRFTNAQFKRLLDSCLTGRTERAPVWQQHIRAEIAQWTSAPPNA